MSARILRLLSIAASAYTALAVGSGQSAAGLPTNPVWEQQWTRVLERFVDEKGRIDFTGLAADPADLDAVVAFVGSVSSETAPRRFATREATIAYYINAYNALAMRGVLSDRSLTRFNLVGRLRFFVMKRFTIGNARMSLYDFENDVIRPLGDERVHFALNCMVVGCPRLPREAFRAADLERQLDQAAREFVNEDRNVRVDAAERTVWLSAIFDFYTVDFLAKAPTLIDYVNRYRTQPLAPDFRTRFLDYDWTINRQ